MAGRYAVVVVLSAACVCSEYTSTVKIAQGKLRGQKSLLTGQHKYLGIPYAVSERFQPPRAPPRWRGIFYATNSFIVCPQKLIVNVGSEDCTVLNVYTPASTGTRSALPVMVFIHGGSFFYGTGSVTNFDPAYLVNHGVIVVTVNYRLGVFGFLCLGIKGAAGNMGLKDQVAALRWVKHNIQAFGGDPNKVTIFGESAGSAAVSMHMLSNMSRGLFNGVIMQSGSATAPWAINKNPIDGARADAAKLGVTSKDPNVILSAFKNISVNQLLDITKDSVLKNVYKYCPCVETNIEDEEVFLSDTPINLLRRGYITQVPAIMGMNSAEGIFFAGLHNPMTLDEMNRNFGEFLPRVFNWDSPKQKLEVENTIRKFYFGNTPIGSDMRNLVDFYSDTLTTHSYPKTVEIMTKVLYTPVYNYLFSYEGQRNFAKYFMGIKGNGVSHADELFYIFKPSSIPLPIIERDRIIIHRMTKMWTNFAKTGNPTPEWTPHVPVKWLPSDANRTIFMNINTTMFMIKTPYQKRIQFWEEIYSSFGIDGWVPTVVTRKSKHDKFIL